MDVNLFQKLLQQNLTTEREFENVEQHEKAVSVFGELRSLLYLGIVLFSTAIGLLIYKHIDTIGHEVLVICIVLVCAACFAFCIKKANGYTNVKPGSPGFCSIIFYCLAACCS
jgi:hypothetical protein